MKAEDKSKLVEVFKGSLWEAELVKGLLEANGVKAVTKDDRPSTWPCPKRPSMSPYW